MLIRYGYELTLNCPRPTTMVCLLDAHRERLRDLRYETRLMTMPEIATSTYLDTFGNTVRRFIAPAGDLTLSRDAVIEDSGVPDAIEEDAKEGPVEQLPNDTLVFLLGSRYCETDKLADIAWQLFGSKPPGSGDLRFRLRPLDLWLRTCVHDPHRLRGLRRAQGRLSRFRPSGGGVLPLHEYSGALCKWILGGHRRAAGPVAYGLQCLVRSLS